MTDKPSSNQTPSPHPPSMEDALRETLKALRDERGWSIETLAAEIQTRRLREGRRGPSHTTIADWERFATPRFGWDSEVLPDYAAVFGTTVDAIWMDAAIRRWGRTRLRTALRRALEG